jgi:hypothetical protein
MDITDENLVGLIDVGLAVLDLLKHLEVSLEACMDA